MFSTLVPPEGAKTVWEDRCILVHLDNSKDVSGAAKLLPSVLLSDDVPQELLPQRAPVYPPDASGDGGEDGAGRASLLERLASHLQAAVSPLAAPLELVWSRFLSGCQPRPAAPPLEWHPRQPLLAAADPRGRVHVLDLGPAGLRPGAGGSQQGLRPEVLLAASGGPGGVKVVLAHEALQQQALSLAWCPTSPGLLAVGAAGAVGLWALAGEARPPLAAAGRAAGPWLRLLRTRVSGARVTSLSWSPDGRLLAAASPNQAGLQVWDVASGVPTSVGAGPAAFDTVRWSPCGNYVFASGTGSRFFYIFETHRWRWARWQTAGGNTTPAGRAAAESPLGPGPAPGPAEAGAASASSSPSSPSVVAAVWAPPADGRHPILLAALSGQSYLVAVHLVDTPPGLTAQLLPVALPEVQLTAAQGSRRGGQRSGGGGGGDGAAGPSGRSAADGSGGSGGGSWRGGSGSGSGAVGVTDMAWEPRGERLAVLFGSDGAAEFVALYATITDPLVSARLIGVARPSDRLCAAAAAAAPPLPAASAGEAAQAGPSSTSATEPGAAAPTSTAAADTAAAPPAAAGAPAPPPSPQGAPPALASLCALSGALTAARLGPGPGAGTGPQCIISARVGGAGVYNLPCYF